MVDQANCSNPVTKKGTVISPNIPTLQGKESCRTNYWMISTIILFLALIGILGQFIINSKTSPNLETESTSQTPDPTRTTQGETLASITLAYVKDGAIFTRDNKGESKKIIDIQDEPILPEKLYMKLSPDKRYLAYLGTSGGLDSAIKIVNIQEMRMVSQDVYGSATISDFAWSPDSKQIVVAINFLYSKNNFTSSIHLIDPHNQTGGKQLFKAENIEITKVSWPDANDIYYSRISYSPEQNTAIVHYDLGSKSRNIRTIKSTNEVYTDISAFSVGYLVSASNKEMLAYVRMKEEPMRSRGNSYELQTLSLPTLEAKPPLLNYVLPVKTDWYLNYLVGIEETYESPVSSVVLIGMPQEKEPLSLLDMGPSGSFHNVKIMEENGKVILVVWSEFDDQHSISAFDLADFIESRKRTEAGEPLWRITDSSSFDVSEVSAGKK